MLVYCIIIILLFVVYLIKKPHYAILTYVPCSILFPNYICLRYTPPALTLHFILDVLFVSYFIFNRSVKLKSFPLFYVYCYLFFLSIIGVVISPIGVLQVIPATISQLMQYMTVVVFYFELRRFKDLKYSTIVIGIIFLLLSIYALGEYIFQNNFLHEYLYATINPDLLKGKLYLSHEIRYSSVRCSSLFPISISWGGFCCLVLSFLTCLLKLYNYKNMTFVYVILVCLVAFNILISGSRSPMFYFAIILSGILFSLNFRTGIIVALLVSVVFIVNSDLLEIIITSMKSNSEIVVGSSVDIRFQQLNAVLNVLNDSPIWGLGSKGIVIAHTRNSEILGAESIWMQQLIFSGLLGVCFQIYLFYTVYKKLTHNLYGFSHILYTVFVIGWVAFVTLTTSPGLPETFFLTIVVLLIKYKKFINKNEYKYYLRLLKKRELA